MRWIAGSMLCGLVLIGGCHNAKKNTEPQQSAAVESDTLQPDLDVTDNGVASYQSPATATTATYDAAEPEPSATYGPVTPSQPVPSSQRTHVVVKGDTLFQLARTYYDDASRWRDIYAANSSVLSDPNKLRVGQELVIP